MSVVVEFEFDAGEHLRAAKAIGGRARARWIGRAMVLAMLLIAGRVVYDAWRDGALIESLLAASPWFLLAGFWALLLWWLPRRVARLSIARDPSIRGAQRRAVDTTGYFSSGNGVVTEVPWHAMYRFVETPEFFLFYYHKELAFYLGKPRLTDAECDVVRELSQSVQSVPPSGTER